MPLRIQTIKTASGPEIPLGDFNVLVGPNNCGKSQTLRDIRDYISSGSNRLLTILKEIKIDFPTQAEAIQDLRIAPHPTAPGHLIYFGVVFDLQRQDQITVQDNWLNQMYSTPSNVALLGAMGKFWVAHLDAESRFHLANPSDCYDTRMQAPSNALQSFFAGGPSAQEQLRQAFRDAFGIDIALDWAAMRKWYLRVGPNFGEIPNDRIALDTLLRDAKDLAAQGDGYRSFAGVVLAMLTFSHRLLLLDEPDAFLHPAQARVLGRWLADYVKTSSTQVILATHNADFLWGIISSNPAAQVIRLNRSSNETRYHLVSSLTTKNLVESPLLSSQPVMDSLFQKGVAICEGDPDRAVYQTVAHDYLKDNGGEDVLFIHSNGKDATKTPVKLLRQTGTPVCAIVDIDVINSEQVLSDILQALTDKRSFPELFALRKNISEFVEKTSDKELLEALKTAVQHWQDSGHSDLRRARKDLEAIAQQASKWTAVKARGFNYFGSGMGLEVQQLIEKCSELGLFIVKKGELEGWITLGVSKGKEWNRRALEALRGKGCPDDLRAFVGEIVSWLRSHQTP